MAMSKASGQQRSPRPCGGACGASALPRVAGELACGQSASPKRDGERLCRPYPILPWSNDVSWQYGEIYPALAAKGQLIGANDLWIAATALVHGMGVVTNHGDEFSRVPGLMVVGY
jgi:predicted nucleic acid-binding protein